MRQHSEFFFFFQSTEMHTNEKKKANRTFGEKNEFTPAHPYAHNNNGKKKNKKKKCGSTTSFFFFQSTEMHTNQNKESTPQEKWKKRKDQIIEKGTDFNTHTTKLDQVKSVGVG